MSSDQFLRRVLKPLVFVAALMPAGYLAWATFTGNLSANPLSDITNGTGDWALRFLCITLGITPLRRISGWNGAITFRRMLGLFAFFYGGLHFLTYVVLDRLAGLDASETNGVVDGLPRAGRSRGSRHPPATIHRRGLHRIRAHDPARGDVDDRHDPAPGRPPLASTSPADVRVVHRSRLALPVARQGRRSQTGRVRCGDCDPAYVSSVLGSHSRKTGIPPAAALEDKIKEPLQIRRGSVWPKAQFLGGLIEAIHPDSRIAERLGAGGIPSPERRKDDVLLA